MKAYPAETTEAFLDGHVSAFSFLGGVPRSILYDNTKLAVAKILEDGRRQRTGAFTELQSYYLFEDRFVSCGSEAIAKHPRSYELDDFVYDPIHYLPLLERKPGALDQAAPLRGWELPDEFGTLRRLLESRMGRRGKREYVQVLRLLETFSQQEVAAAAKDAIRLGAVSFDAVKHLVLCRLEGRPPKLDLELYPYLPRVRVSTTSAGDYMTLLSGRAA